MRPSLTIPLLILLLLFSACAGPFMIRKTNWSVAEVREWYPVYREDSSSWDGILYQGSDAREHHFIARLQSMDNWVVIDIKKSELTLPDERPYYPAISTGPYAYYYVDPTNNFTKLRDFK